MSPKIPLHDARFKYIPSRDHDEGTTFRERQLARIKAANEARQLREAETRQQYNVSINDLGFQMYALPRPKERTA